MILLSFLFFLPFTFTTDTGTHGYIVNESSRNADCRFATKYSQSAILSDPEAFEQNVIYWEGMFHQDKVSYNAFNGMTFDGTLLDTVTGVHNTDGLHTFSAASKESLHIMLLAHVIEGNLKAARWILAAHGAGSDIEEARSLAINILQRKWVAYSNFNKTYPGFGGFLPWFAHEGDTQLAPTWDWVNRVPGLDNGENIWAIYALIEALESVGRAEYSHLARSWSSYLDYLKQTVQTIFYRGSGRICAVTNGFNQSLPVSHPAQLYTCEGLDSGGNPYLNDPYEGQQLMWFIYLFTDLNQTEKEAIWDFKRPQLVATDWSHSGYKNITVQKGFWFSSHENWGWMQMPYTDVPLMSKLYANMERARTCNSHAKRIPGMYASVNNSTDNDGQIIGYISNAGIPTVANQTVQELDVITPYSTMNTMIVNKTVGLVWWHSIVVTKRMQNLYGSSESTRIDGTATSAFVSWDSKMTTVNGLFGGVIALVRRRMQREGIYDAFISLSSVPDMGLKDFTSCK